MELRQLRYFIKAAELSNFTEAANALFISQSTLSQQIQQLETELKTNLFDRIGKRVRLTEAGKIFLPSARKTVKTGDDGKQVLMDLSELTAGTLIVGLTYGLSDLAIRSIRVFAEMYPKVLVQMIYGTSELLIQNLAEGKIDFILSFSSKQPSTEFDTVHLFESNLSLIVHEGHFLANKQHIKLSEIQTLPLALPIGGFSIRGALDAHISSQQIQLDIRMEANDIITLLQMADAGTWCTILMGSSIFNFPKLRAIPIAGKEMLIKATVIWPTDSYRKKASRIFVSIVQSQASMKTEI